MFLSVGVDLAASPEYGARRYGRVGLAALDGDLRAVTAAGHLGDGDIIAWIEEHAPAVVAVDSPLSLPRGRCCADPACACARFGIVRAADRAVARLGHHPYWALLPSMRPLTLRGIALRRELVARGFCVREVFPGGVQDALGIPRKRHDRQGLVDGLRRLGMSCDLDRCCPDELDALTATYAGLMFARGRYTAIGPDDEVQVIYPAPGAIAAAPQEAIP